MTTESQRYNCFTRNERNAIPKHASPEAKGSNPTAGLTLFWAGNQFRGNFNHCQVSRKDAGQIFLNDNIPNYNTRNSPRAVFRDYYQKYEGERWSWHNVVSGEEDKKRTRTHINSHTHTHTHTYQKVPKLTYNHWTLRPFHERTEFISGYLQRDLTSNSHFVVFRRRLCVLCCNVLCTVSPRVQWYLG